MVSGAAGQLRPQGSCCGSRAARSLHHPAQPALLVSCQTGAPVDARGPQQDGILLHHCTGPPGATIYMLLLS